MKKSLLFFIITVGFTQSYNRAWVRIYGDMGVYLAGKGDEIVSISGDFKVMKLDSSGNITWVDTAGQYYTGDIGYSIALDKTGNIVAGGSVFIDTLGYQIRIRKYFSDGPLFWERILDFFGQGYFQIEGIALDSINNVIAVAHSMYYYDYTYLLKYDSLGNLIKMDTLFLNLIYPRGLTIDFENNIILLGDIDDIGFKIFILKMDSNFNILWSDTLNYTTLSRDIKTDAQGNIFITALLTDFTFFDILTLKLSSDGIVQWADTFDLDYDEYPMALSVDSSGNSAVAGLLKEPCGSNFLLLIYSPDGNLEFFDILDTAKYDYGTGVYMDKNRNVYLSGWSYIGTVIAKYNYSFKITEPDLYESKEPLFDFQYKKGHIIIRFLGNFPQSIHFALYDPVGRKIHLQFKREDNSYIGNVSFLKSGVYFLRVKFKDKSFTKRFIVFKNNDRKF